MRLARISPLRPMRLLGLLAVALWAVGLGSAATGSAADPAPASPAAAKPDAKPADPLDSSDPDLLRARAAAALAHGDKPLAEAAFRASLRKSELAVYFAVKDKPWEGAALAEWMGDASGADALWQKSLDADPIATTIAIRQFVEGPRHGELLARAQARLGQLTQALEAGTPVTLPGPDGVPHALEKLDAKAAIEKLKKGEPLKFVYIPELDLSGQSFDQKVLIARSVIGKLSTYNSHFADFYVQHAVVGELRLGQHWAGEVNKSAKLPAGTFATLGLREVVVTGASGLEGVSASRLGLLAFATFLGPCDLRNASFPGTADLRFVSFVTDAQLRGMELGTAAYLGGMRIDGNADLTGLRAHRAMVDFNGDRFFGAVTLDLAQLERGATFEGSRISGQALLTRMRVGDKLALNRVVLDGTVRLDESDIEALDMFGARVGGTFSLADVRIRGAARFALDSGQRRRFERDRSGLPRVYRLYQGDEDSDPAFFSGPAYGVEGVDDLTTRFLGRVGFPDLTVEGRMIMEGVTIGTPESPAVVYFVGARLGELHLERATIHGRLDLSAMAGREVAISKGKLDGALVLDDVNVSGRLSLSDLVLSDKSDLSFRGASIGSFQIARSQVERADGTHALFYERCAQGQTEHPEKDLRLARDLTEADKAQDVCFDDMLDEYSTLQDAFAKQALPADHDWAYWFQRHYATQKDLRDGDAATKISAAVQWLIFEKGFGWGVRLGNILMTALVLSLIFSFIYRAACHDTEVKFNGEIHVLKNMSQLALFTMSLQSIIGANIGWEVMGKDRRFKYVNTILTIIGIILITFFVGAYTRMVLA